MRRTTATVSGAPIAAARGQLRVPFLCWGPVFGGLLALAIGRGAGIGGLALSVLGGFALWTLLEYLVHRFLLHLVPRGRLRRLFAGRHVLHHRNPVGYPGVVLLWVAALNGVAALLLLAALVGLTHGAAVLAGLVAGYLAYEAMHLWVHVETHPRTRLGRWLRLHHMLHHARDPKTNFAILLPLWDRVFGTSCRPARG